ncbi:MAG TPA: hypothetical protein VM848_08260 [Acidimicrobiia bacterium]|nr:hypothetical protein [Acidimicrobiia bacterium]
MSEFRTAGVGEIEVVRRTCLLMPSILIAAGCGRVSSVGEQPPPLVVKTGDARLEL